MEEAGTPPQGPVAFCHLMIHAQHLLQEGFSSHHLGLDPRAPAQEPWTVTQTGTFRSPGRQTESVECTRNRTSGPKEKRGGPDSQRRQREE